jgi:hypothetical protein
LIGSGSDPRPIVAQARHEGVQIPFIHFVRENSESFLGDGGETLGETLCLLVLN